MPGFWLKSMRGWSAARRRWAATLFVLVVTPVAMYTGARMGTVFVQADTESYLAMARGESAMMPFAARQLGPLLARTVAHAVPTPTENAFFDLGVIYLVFFVGTVAFLLVRSGAPAWMVPSVAAMMFWGFQFNALVMPDLLYAALLCGFLLLLRGQQVMAACLLLFPMMLARESTLLTLACFLAADWRDLRRREVVAATVSVLAGWLTVARLTANALPNKEHFPPMVYLLAKVPWNFMRNVLGIGVWANVYPTCDVPRWQMALHLGPLQTVGICGVSGELPGRSFGVGMAIFGLLPVLLWMVRRPAFRTVGRADLLLRFALLYGAVSFLAAPLLGEVFQRLYSYGWPLFLVALPLLLGRAGWNFTSAWAAAGFVGLHGLLAWSLVWAYPTPLFSVAAMGWVLGALLLRATFRRPTLGRLE